MIVLTRSLRLLLLTTTAVGCFVLSVFLIRWARRPLPNSAEGILARADELAWNNNWYQAAPLYIQAEEMFRRRNDLGHALYAHVSQFGLKMESGNLSELIAELASDLHLPEASAPEVRLRILEMKAKCEEEYDGGIAKQTFAEVESLAFRRHKYYLASRASGEQGILAFTLGNTSEAAARVKRAYGVAKYLGDPAAHIRYAEMIGMGITRMGRPKQALKFLDEAIAAQQRHPEVARPMVAYGAKIDSLDQLGFHREALALADDALAFPRQHRFLGQLQSLLTNKADVLVSLGRTSDAIAAYQEALSYAKQLHSWRAITYIDGKLASTYERTGQLPAALNAIGEAIAANQQTPQEMFLAPGNLAIKARLEAKMGHRAAAERLYQKGADVLDVLLSHVPTPETERLLLAELSDLYSGYFELLSDDGRYDEAFQVIEKAHGRIETQQLEYDHTQIPHAETPEEKRLQALETGLLNEDNARKREEVLREISPSPRDPENDSTEKAATLREVQGKLDAREVLIEYVLSKPRSYALAISTTGVKRYTLPPKETVEGEAAAYRDVLRNRQTDVKLGQKVFDELLGFTKDDPNVKSLIIVPDGGLHLLPFSALVSDRGKYLLEDESIGIAPSGTVLSLLRSRASQSSANRPYLGVAAWTDSVDSRPWVLRAVSGNSQSRDLPPLPESRNEVESIAALMPRPPMILLGQAATKEHFRQLPLGEYRVLHLALHGVVDPIFPDRSALVFAPSPNDDGRLEARDIRQLHLHAELVTLSACDTGVGPVSASGVESVVAAFIQAGARSVVSTLWELEDHASNKLMKSFYSQLGANSEADALRQAKLDLLRAGLSPYYWASYEIVGDSQRPLLQTK